MTTSQRHRLPLTCLAALLAASPVGCADVPAEAVGEVDSAMRGSGVTTEPISINYTDARETMFVDDAACTGTVIGPYAVLTLGRCRSSSPPGTISWPASGVTFPIGASYASPYMNSRWWPAWWKTLYQQATSLTDSYPENHDVGIHFVPGLDEYFIGTRLRYNNWRPAALDARADATRYLMVGNDIPSSTVRTLASVTFDAATPNLITVGSGCSNNRDGFFSIHTSATIYSSDWGGPVLGSILHPWQGAVVEGPRHVVSVTANRCADAAPLAYDNGRTLTPNQLSTVARNDLWLRALASDADGDLVPYECDGAPGDPLNNLNGCPAPLGGPADPQVPRGLLTCDPGFVATGLRGTHGLVLDRLSVECTPISCLERPDLPCPNVRVTDTFAGNSQSSTAAFARDCPAGRAIGAIAGRHDQGALVRELSVVCFNYPYLRDGSGTAGTTHLVPVGNYEGRAGFGAAYPETACEQGSVLVGFEARSDQESANDSLAFITGLQPVCRDVSQIEPYQGGLGGDPHQLSCPLGFVGVGTVQNTTASGAAVGMFGLLCAEKYKVSRGLPTTDDDLIVAHTSFATNASERYPALMEKYSVFQARQPAGTTVAKCATGRAVDEIDYRAGTLVDQITSLRCRNPSDDSTRGLVVGVGGPGGTARAAACPARAYVSGLLARSGWSLDGLAPRCEPY